MTPDELAALRKIDAEFGRMSGPAHEELWTLEAIQQDESWSTIRRLAREALHALGTKPAEPVLDWVRVV